MRKLDPELQAKLAQLIEAMGYELFGCQLAPYGHQVLLRLYIDSPKGVTVDDCSLVSRQVSAFLDVEDPISERYTLEVSSPGIDRPLLSVEHYQRYIGKKVNVRLFMAIEKRKQFKGIIQSVDDDRVAILLEGEEQAISLPFTAIAKANLIG